MINDLLIRLRALFRRRQVEKDLDDELQFHFDHQVEEFIRRGVPEFEAVQRTRQLNRSVSCVMRGSVPPGQQETQASSMGSPYQSE